MFRDLLFRERSPPPALRRCNSRGPMASPCLRYRAYAQRRSEEPGRLLLTDLIVKCPCLMLCLFLGPAIYLSVLGLSHELKFDVGISAFQIRESHFSQQREKASVGASRDENSYASLHRRRQLQWDAPQPAGREVARAYILDRVELIMFWNDQRNMLSAQGLQRAVEVERAIEAVAGYDDFCVTNPAIFGSHVCAPPTSLTTYFFPSARPNTTELSYDGRGPAIVDLQVLPPAPTCNQPGPLRTVSHGIYIS
jgi:hypothetical protein